MTLKSKTILVVEDDKDIVFSLHLLLEAKGYTIQSAGNGLIALEYLQTHGMPELILLDMKMPIMSGWDFSVEFSANYKKRCPVIVMTAAADAKNRAKDINATGWIEKPFILKDLSDLVEATLQ